MRRNLGVANLWRCCASSDFVGVHGDLDEFSGKGSVTSAQEEFDNLRRPTRAASRWKKSLAAGGLSIYSN